VSNNPKVISGSCPCIYTTPCTPDCSCVNCFSSHGCRRCCAYGSLQQRRDRAESLAIIIDAGFASPAPTHATGGQQG
jgi:hypothetical protein